MSGFVGLLGTIRLVRKAQGLVNAENPRSVAHGFAEYSPLIASIIAPFTTLFDIPALTQHWYSFNGQAIFDYKASIALSAVGLALNIVAEIFLIFRFSASTRRWILATRLSLLFWLLKTGVAVGNLVAFGLYSRNESGFKYQEGFFCAVASCIGAGIIASLLIFHYIEEVRTKHGDDLGLRITGRRFILSLLALVMILAVQGLVFSRLEGWLYFDGIYFSVVVMTTIGFGDLLATRTVTKVILFPFAVIAIASLANQVSLIITFFSARSKQQSQQLWARYRQLQQEKMKHEDEDDLERELKFQKHLTHVQARWQVTIDFLISMTALLLFWTFGAVVFAKIEGWTVGNGYYFGYITFLSCGFGDFTPKTPLGRVFFVLWAVLAVPFIASFAVQAMSNTITMVAHSSFFKGNNARTQSGGRQPSVSQSKLILKHTNTLAASTYTNELTMEPGSPFVEKAYEGEKDENDRRFSTAPEDMVSVNRHQLKKLVQDICELDGCARRIMIQGFQPKSHVALLLKADEAIQLRQMRRMNLEDSNFQFLDDFGLTDEPHMLEWENTLTKQVDGYRNRFAELLASGHHLEEFAKRRRQTSDVDCTGSGSSGSLVDKV